MQKRIVVEHVSKYFQIGTEKRQSTLGKIYSLFSGREPKKSIHVLSDVSFVVNAGEVLGIMGSNGSGKSTLMRIVAGIYRVYDGTVKVEGKMVSLINLSVGLKERLTMRENIFLIGSLFGLGQDDIKARFNDIVAFAELGEFVNTKIYQFSSGMRQRLIFATAVHANADILILDEVLEVGDKSFKEKSGNKIKEIVKGGGSVVLVSHNALLIEKYCHRVMLIEKGVIKSQELLPANHETK